MAKEQKNLRIILLLLAGLVLFLWLMGKVSRVSGQETLVNEELLKLGMAGKL